MEKEFNATNGVHVKMTVPIEVSEAEKQRKIEALYDALNTNTSIYSWFCSDSKWTSRSRKTCLWNV